VQLLAVPALRRFVGLLPAGSGAHVAPDPSTDVYTWGGWSIEFHRCRNCGCVSHWVAADRKRNRMGVNARLMPPENLAEARLRHRAGAGTNRYTV
jgi:hypothetical protein